MLSQASLDLSQLDTEATYLDLIIQTAEIFNCTIAAVAILPSGLPVSDSLAPGQCLQ